MSHDTPIIDQDTPTTPSPFGPSQPVDTKLAPANQTKRLGGPANSYTRPDAPSRWPVPPISASELYPVEFSYRYISASAAWSRTFGRVIGYKLLRAAAESGRGGNTDVVQFDDPAAAVVRAALGGWTPKTQNDSQRCQLAIWWRKENARANGKIIRTLELVRDVDYDWRADTNSYPREDAMIQPAEPTAKEQLDAAFPRDVSGQPIDPTTAETGEAPRHFSADPKWRMAVKSARERYRTSAMMSSEDVNAWLHKIFGVQSLKELSLRPEVALQIINENLEREFGEKQNVDEKAPNLNETAPARPETPETPATPRAAEKSSVETGNGAAVSNGMNEAAFVVLVNLYAPWGAEMKFTIRAMTVETLASQVDSLIATFTGRGYKMARDNATPASNAPAPTPGAANTGTAFCSFMKVEASYSGNKPQLNFECDGFEKPLRYTRDNLAHILKGVTNPKTGKPFTSEDLTLNAKFAGNWIVEWERIEKDGKHYTNVVAVRAAANASTAA